MSGSADKTLKARVSSPKARVSSPKARVSSPKAEFQDLNNDVLSVIKGKLSDTELARFLLATKNRAENKPEDDAKIRSVTTRVNKLQQNLHRAFYSLLFHEAALTIDVSPVPDAETLVEILSSFDNRIENPGKMRTINGLINNHDKYHFRIKVQTRRVKNLKKKAEREKYESDMLDKVFIDVYLWQGNSTFEKSPFLSFDCGEIHELNRDSPATFLKLITSIINKTTDTEYTIFTSGNYRVRMEFVEDWLHDFVMYMKYMGVKNENIEYGIK
jgi:hypothetical protein